MEKVYLSWLRKLSGLPATHLINSSACQIKFSIHSTKPSFCIYTCHRVRKMCSQTSWCLNPEPVAYKASALLTEISGCQTHFLPIWWLSPNRNIMKLCLVPTGNTKKRLSNTAGFQTLHLNDPVVTKN